MEPKKNPKYDIHRHHGVLLNVGLAISLLLMIGAFKWKMAAENEGPPDLPYQDNWNDEILPDVVPVSSHTRTPAVQQRQVRASLPVPSYASIVEVENILETEAPIPVIDQEQPIDYNTGLDIPEEVAPPDTFRIVEKMPEPVGGWAAFYQILQKNLHYPMKAQRNDVSGKVFVEFVVNDKGQLSQIKVIKGIGQGCDEEAARVLALTKWKSGKQRGQPVNVRMVQPIAFSLNR
jgi:periplasmic protein TonB